MRTRTFLRAIVLGCTICLTLHPHAALAQKGPVGRDGSDVPVRITGTIPGYLELDAQLGTTMYGQGQTRLVQVRVRANTPWTLQARATGLAAGATCALRQSTAQAQWTTLDGGAMTPVPCDVKHFAGEQDLLLEWSLEGPPGQVGLELLLAPVDQAQAMTPEAMRSTRLAWGLMKGPILPTPAGATHSPRFAWPMIPLSEYAPAILIQQ